MRQDRVGALAASFYSLCVVGIARHVNVASMAPRATPSTRCPTQPFAALLLNGFKTLETRNNELFAPYEGRRVVVRVGMKDWDNASWKLWHPAGAADLRPGFRRGDAAGVVDVGETRRLLRGRGAARLRLRRGLWGFRHGHIEREVVPEAVARARLPGRRRPRRAGGPRRRGGRGGHGEGGRSPGDRRRRGAREEDGEPGQRRARLQSGPGAAA